MLVLLGEDEVHCTGGEVVPFSASAVPTTASKKRKIIIVGGQKVSPALPSLLLRRRRVNLAVPIVPCRH